MDNKNVSHPKHYAGSTSLECIEVMELLIGYEAVANYCLCNSFKYLWRYKNKNGQEDVEKALWYLNWVQHKIDLNFEFSNEFLNLYERTNELCISIDDKIANGDD